jgi:hypothetical protein
LLLLGILLENVADVGFWCIMMRLGGMICLLCLRRDWIRCSLVCVVYKVLMGLGYRFLRLLDVEGRLVPGAVLMIRVCKK